MERSEWPTQDKLSSLRRRGIVPKSSYVCLCAASFGMMLGLMLGKQACKDLFLVGLTQATLFNDASLRSITLRNFTQILIFPMLFSSLFYFVCGLLQTKFMLNFASLWDLTRLNPLRSKSLGYLFKNIIAAGVSGLLCLIFSYFIWSMLAANILRLLNADAKFMSQWAGQFLLSVASGFGIFLILTAVCAYFMSRYVFMWQHRMSREEIKREGSE